MPERRVTGRPRRSIGFPMLTLMLATAAAGLAAWSALELLSGAHMPF